MNDAALRIYLTLQWQLEHELAWILKLGAPYCYWLLYFLSLVMLSEYFGFEQKRDLFVYAFKVWHHNDFRGGSPFMVPDFHCAMGPCTPAVSLLLAWAWCYWATVSWNTSERRCKYNFVSFCVTLRSLQCQRDVQLTASHVFPNYVMSCKVCSESTWERHPWFWW
jgi:hypothetical protein